MAEKGEREMNYREAIDWLYSTQLFGIKLGLDGPRRLLKEFLAYPSYGTKVIHIAGTNGKGSTCALIDSVARAGGARTALFTSPHLIDFRERMKVSGAEIDEYECADLLTKVRSICERLDPHPTFFEITLAVAMRWFREREVELIILETGMGGRLDATTAVPADVCGITPVGMDHVQWLGDTLEKIAFEKAGILVEGKPAISSPQEPEVQQVFEREANERRTPLSFVEMPLEGYGIGLPGAHQKWNAALALDCLHAAGLRLDFETVSYGLMSVRWPGRFEVVEHDGQTFVFDGAHNPASAKALAGTWRERYGDRKAALLFSAVATKDVAGIVEHLEPLAEEIHVCPVDSPRAVEIAELAAAFKSRVISHESVEQAVAGLAHTGELTLVAGSLFLIGEVKALQAKQTRRVSEQ